MDVIDRQSVKIPNAVIVSGIAGDEQTEEVVEFMKQYGSISRVIQVDDRTSKFHQCIVIEYSSGNAVEGIDPLPFDYVSESGVCSKIQSLASVYTQSVGNNTTESYLIDLQNLAKKSGRDYAEVLKDMISQINDSIKEIVLEPAKPINSSDNAPASPLAEPQPSVVEPNMRGAQENATNLTFNPPSSPAQSIPAISAHDLNPPEVQRVVVEHIVKREEYSGQHFFQKLRVFSGKEPRPAYEPDYDTWRSSVELVMTDASMSPLQQSRKIIESLLPPAADVVRHLNPNSSPTEYLQLLDSAYGTVQDGGELFAKFLDTFQNTGEKPSTYLQRLQAALTLTVKRGGAASNDFDKLLLTQFCRGCWDDFLLTELQLKQKRTSPPTFPDLLLLLRTEEDQHAAKTKRMRQYLGSTKPKVTSHMQSAKCVTEEESNIVTLSTITKELSKQVAEIQSQLVKLTKPPKTKPPKPKSEPSVRPKEKQNSERKIKEPAEQSQTQNMPPKPWYCFQCGEDGHVKPNCESEPNPALVSEKRKLFKEKLRKWEAENPTVASEQLN